LRRIVIFGAALLIIQGAIYAEFHLDWPEATVIYVALIVVFLIILRHEAKRVSSGMTADKPWFLKVQTEEWQRANELYQPFRTYMESLRKKYSVPEDVRLVLLMV